jgi:hypothetical protein
MAITVQIENESGGRKGDLWIHPESSRLLAPRSSRTSCLQFIDPYGNTVFNQLQIPQLISELKALDQTLTDPKLRLALAGLVSFIQNAVDKVHMYVRFIGD